MQLKIERIEKSYKWYPKDTDGSKYCCTNSFGGGILVVDTLQGKMVQYEESEDFTVSGLKDRSAREKIRKYMKQHPRVLDLYL